MAIPKVFISSTCYDLKYIRENVKYFINQIGYDPVLSEDGTIYFDPKTHTHDACLTEVPNCQMFILIIGGRYGGLFKDSETSITNNEFKKAFELKIPIFTLVEQTVYNEHYFYTKNKKNQNIDFSKIIYPSVDSIKIFDFIDEVKMKSVNNAISAFRDFSDIELYLKRQWAGMLFSFLTKMNEEARIGDTLSLLSSVNNRIEMLSRQILDSVGNDKARLTAELYDEMFYHDCINDLKIMKLRPKPVDVIRANDYFSLAENLGMKLNILFTNEEEFENSIWANGKIGEKRIEMHLNDFQMLKLALLEILSKHKISIDTYLNEQ